MTVRGRFRWSRAALWGAVVAALTVGGCRTARQDAPVVDSADNLPIVLAHGLSGFRTLSGVDYFHGVVDALEAHGHRVVAAEVPPWSPVDVRAEHLGRQVDAFVRRTGARGVHIVAHSMGGLDARHMVTHLGRAGLVASITTVGTPHRGSPIADRYDAINLAPTHPLQDLSADFFIWTLGGAKVRSDTAGAVQTLSVEWLRGFNARTPDMPTVRYYSFAGRTLGHDGKGYCDDAELPDSHELHLVHPLMMSGAVFLSGLDVRHPVANDGLVTVPSARWGIFMGCLPADHMREVGQPIMPTLPGRWDPVDFYVDWVRQLTSGEARRYGKTRPSSSVP